MTNSKTTKRALFSSVVALLLCFTMLLGTTFAWFTDNASTSVNTIHAGTLDIQLLDVNGDSLEGKTLAWQKANGHENDTVLWEPGCTYNLQTIIIKNNGNLALKYKIEISGIQGDAKLNEVIDWKITTTNSVSDLGADHSLAAGQTNMLTISGTMQTTAGNDYQGLKIEGIAIKVLATQDTVEYDSNNNQYDKDAEYDTSVNPGTPNPPAGYAEAFADNSWEDIIEACQNNSVPATWNVGDTKTMTIGGDEYTIAIIGKNHDTYSDGSGNAPLTFQLTQMYAGERMNATADNSTGWSGSEMRTTTMSEILAAMPSEVQNAIKAVDKLTLKGDKSGLETTSDKLFLLSETEVTGGSYWNGGYEEGSRYDAFYNDVSTQIMSPLNRDVVSWWLRTPKNDSANTDRFMAINGSGYATSGTAEITTFGVVFGFCF